MRKIFFTNIEGISDLLNMSVCTTCEGRRIWYQTKANQEQHGSKWIWKLMPQSHWAPGTPRFTPVHGPGWTGEYRGLNRSATMMDRDDAWWTWMNRVLSGGFWHVKNHRSEPWRTGKGSPTWVNRVEPCWHRRSTGKDREGSWRCRRWPGSTGMENIEGRITKTTTNFRKPLSPALKLAITLRYIAAGDSPIYTAFSPRRDEPWWTGKDRSSAMENREEP